MSRKKKLVGALTVCAVSCATAIPAFCAEGDSTVVTSMGTAMAPVKTDALAALATVAPYGIAIMGAFLVWKYGIKFFKSLAK